MKQFQPLHQHKCGISIVGAGPLGRINDLLVFEKFRLFQPSDFADRKNMI